MSAQFDLHPDFRSLKGHKQIVGPWILALLARFLAAVNVLHRRKFKSIVTLSRITGGDGYHVPVLVIRPEQLDKPAPVLIYFHGGAFVFKHAPQHLENAVRYAREVKCLVIFVDYRLAPKHPFPAAFNDCYAALRWTLSNVTQLGIDAQRIVVGGDSAGGTLAAGVAQKARDEGSIKLCAQLLIYPSLDARGETPSSTAYANVAPFKAASRAQLWTLYLGKAPSAPLPAYASPMDASNLRGLADAYVELAQFDILHDEGYAYAQALIEQGVKVSLNEVKGAVHGFDLLVADSDVSKGAVQSRINFLRQVFRH